MKDFFSLKGKFNIFFVTGLFLVFFSLYLNLYHHKNNTFTLIGLLIGLIPELYQSIIEFKESRKINPIIMAYAFVFITLAIIVGFDFLNI